MPTFQDVREISLALPEVEEHVTWGTDVKLRVRDAWRSTAPARLRGLVPD